MSTVDPIKLEYGSGTMYAGFPSSPGFGVGGPSYSNFLASPVSQSTRNDGFRPTVAHH